MSNQLTKDADKMICVIYKNYLQRRKDKVPKSTALDFTLNDLKCYFPDWIPDDIEETLIELKTAGFITLDILGNFELKSDAIIHMENRFKKGLLDVTDFIAKFIP